MPGIKHGIVHKSGYTFSFYQISFFGVGNRKNPETNSLRKSNA